MRKAREQFELFTFEQIHLIDELRNDGVWVCDCGTVQTELFHCPICKAEPPGGCVCPQCCDPVCLWGS